MKKTFLGRLNRMTTLLVLALSMIALFPMKGFTEEETLNFYVTPEFPKSQVEGSESYFDVNLSPNENETLALTLQNASDEAVKIAITSHTAYTNVNGIVEYGKNAEETDPSLIHSLDELIKNPETVELAGKETKTVTLQLKMPGEAFKGFLAGGLRISELKEDTQEEKAEGEGLAIKNEFAYVIGVVVSNSRDAVQPDLALLDVFPDQLNYRNVISATLQNFTPTFVNRLEVEASVKRKGEDEVLYEASKEQMQMAPNSHFSFPISLNGERFRSGDYVLNLTAVSGEEEWSWTEEFTIDTDQARSLNREDVTLINTTNWWLIAAFTLVLLLIILVVWLMNKNRKQKMIIKGGSISDEN